jgi:Cytochrome P450
LHRTQRAAYQCRRLIQSYLQPIQPLSQICSILRRIQHSTHVFAETDPVLHKERRRLLNPLFSRDGLFKLEPIIQQKVKMLLDKIHLLAGNGPVNVMMLSGEIYDELVWSLLTKTPVRLMTTEVILQFAFGRSGALLKRIRTVSAPGFWRASTPLQKSIPDLQYKPWLRHLTNVIPQALVYKLVRKLEICWILQRYISMLSKT